MRPVRPFFRAVGIIAVQIAGGAAAGIVHALYARGSGLPNDLRREVDLIVRRSNAGAELHDKIAWPRAETFPHFLDRARDDRQFRPLLPGMNEPDAALDRIDQVNGAAISDINA